MSDLFALDSRGQKERDQQAIDYGVEVRDLPPSTFANLGNSLALGVPRIFTGLASAAEMAGSVPLAWAERQIRQPGRFTDPYFEAVDPYVEDAINYWTPDARTTGRGSQVLGGMVEGLGQFAIGLGNPLPMIAAQESGTAKRLVREGVGAPTSVASGVLAGLATAVGVKIPLGNTLASRIGSGVGGNVALGVVDQATANALLRVSGNETHAQQFTALDGPELLANAVMGIAFGTAAHVQARGARPARVPPSAVDAALTVLNAKHFQSDTAPGVPADLASTAAHHQTMEQAITQLVAGDPVSTPMAIEEARFIPRPKEPLPELPPELIALDKERAAAAEAAAAAVPVEPPAAPVAEPVQPLPRIKTVKGQRPPDDASRMDVLEFLSTKMMTGKGGKQWYGIDWDEAVAQGLDPADLKTAKGVGWFRPFVKGGASFDAVAEALAEAGYPVTETIGGQTRYTANKVLDVLDRALHGEKIYSNNSDLGREKDAADRAFNQAEYDRLKAQEGPTPEELQAIREDLTPEGPAPTPADVKDLHYVALARELDEATVERLAAQHENDADFIKAIKEFVDAQYQATAGGLEAGAGTMAPGAAGAGRDLFGQDTRTAQGLANETRRRDLIRSPNKDVSLETGDPTDLFSDSRKQIDMVLQSAQEAALADPTLRVPTGEIAADGTAVMAPAADLMAQAEAEVVKAENDSKGFEAAVNCFLQSGGG